MQNSQVLEVGVIGYCKDHSGSEALSDYIGNEIVACIVKKDEINKKGIIKYCQQHLPIHKIPKTICFVDESPKTSSGKIQRNVLKEMYRRGVIT